MKYLAVFLLGICFVFGAANGQDPKIIDSLSRILQVKDGAARFPVLYEMSFQYIQKENERALDYINQAEDAALLSGDSLSIVKTKRVKGQILYFLERNQESAESFITALPIAIRNQFSTEVLYIQRFLGRIYLYDGRYDSALKYSFENLDHAKLSGDMESIAYALHSIGLTYYKLKDYKTALMYLHKSYQLHGYINGPTFFILTNIGLCYAYLDDCLNAQFYVDQSFRACGTNCSAKDLINIEYALGLISKGEGKLGSAERHFLKSYSLSEQENDTRFQFDNIYLLTELYIVQKRIDEAEFYLSRAEGQIGPNVPFNLELIKIYSRFSEFYLETGDYRKAAEYQARYIRLKDSVYNEELTTNLMRTEAGYLDRENKLKIRVQDEIISLKEKIINRQQLLNISTAMLGVIGFVFLGFLFRNFKEKKKLNLILEQKIRERTHELELNHDALMKVIREKDLRISRTSDTMLQTIHSIKGLCSVGAKEVSGVAAAISYLDKIDERSNKLIEYLRSLLNEEKIGSSMEVIQETPPV